MFDQNDQNQQVQNTVAPEPVATPTDDTNLTQPVADQPTATAPVPEPAADPSFNATVIDTPEENVVEPVVEAPAVVAPATQEASNDEAPSQSSDDLLSIKKDALQSLSPLLSQLDQSPEEKFRTTMMLIQASDDQSLIQTAYNAAKDIEDEKVRAQALLDIVNEINYFTQAKEKSAA